PVVPAAGETPTLLVMPSANAPIDELMVWL
ncbi:MAG: hypothetical protein ACI8XO_002030, partial [Verrucomicrobiales bacterium]